MHQALQNIATELDQLAVQITGSIPVAQPFGIAHSNWSFPLITSEEIRERVEEIAKDIRDRGKDSLDPTTEARLNDYPRRLVFLRGSTIPNVWGSAQAGVSAVNETLDGLVRALRPALSSDVAQDTSIRLSRLRGQISGLETRLKTLQPRAMPLEEMIRAVEDTYAAANELPSSLEEVQDAKDRVEKVKAEIDAHLVRISNASTQASSSIEDLERLSKQAKEFMDGCETAYRSSVAQGLAAAFLERSKQLNINMWVWVAGLILSLISGIFWGGTKIQALALAAHSSEATSATLVFDGVMAAISVAAPVWFAWLATRQIGITFRLSEDYAYKASVARSYEGYRKEAQSVSDALVSELLTSAIRRVDEQPLRVVEHTSPGSPIHDLSSSPVVRRAVETVPEFAQTVREMASRALSKKSDSGQKADAP